MTDLNEIRWNIYSYLAYGFKAFSYFNYVCPGESDTEGEGFYDSLIYRDGTIRDQDLFDGVSALNWQVRALSPIVMNSDVSAAYHTAEGVRRGENAAFRLFPAPENGRRLYRFVYGK